MTFQEKVEPLSKNEEGQLMGGFASVELPDELARAGLVNGKDCTNYDCPEDSKNKESVKMTIAEFVPVVVILAENYPETFHAQVSVR